MHRLQHLRKKVQVAARLPGGVISQDSIRSWSYLLTVISLKRESNGSEAKPKVRRVLPEHEGRYKITLPSGTTERSKQIMAKRQMRMLNAFLHSTWNAVYFNSNHPNIISHTFSVYADNDEPKKGIFDRLENKSRTQDKSDRSSSIFSRLGGKNDDGDEDMELDEKVAVRFAGTMKSAPKKVNCVELAIESF